MLTKKIREKGSLLGKIEFAGQPVAIEDPNLRNLVAEVSLKVPRVFNAGKSPRIVAVDCGIKNNIIRCLCQQEVQVTVVPFDYDLKAHAAEYDGIFISNGPGNPEMAQATIEQLKWAITTDIPIFGICLGNQLLALAAGGRTYKMKFGNRGANVPCVDLLSGQCYITSQNHGFAVDEASLPAEWQPLFFNANDYSNEGIIHRTKKIFSSQFHPEASAGPLDTRFLFKRFIDNVRGVETPLRAPLNTHFFRLQKFRKVLILGSGGLSIGQAGEFDYSGSQAIKALKEEGLEVVLMNPNIATVQTSKNLANKVYFLPVTTEFVKRVLDKEQPDCLLVSMGGQTALNVGIALYESGDLARRGVHVLGTPIQTVIDTEDRELFKERLDEIHEKLALSYPATTVEEAIEVAERIGYPVLVRSAFALGGLGSGFAESREELVELVSRSFTCSEQLLIDKDLRGWKEIEYEVVRDCYDNCVTVCNMENFDPLGIHTGDSIVVAPSQTLTNREYMMLRDTAIKVVRHLGVIGECNIQYALNPESEEYCIIEVNARLSRSSALASKATGYPLAYVAAKLALGNNLIQISNRVTGTTTACFEPSLDYCVVKVPRWDLKKFHRVSPLLGSCMKSVGEVMSIGRRFEEALQKAVRMVNPLVQGFDLPAVEWSEAEVLSLLKHPDDRRIHAIALAMERGMSVADIHAVTKIDKWFLNKLDHIHRARAWLKGRALAELGKERMKVLKCLGFSDLQIANALAFSAEQAGLSKREKESLVRAQRKAEGVVPVVKQVDTLAAEFPAMTNYLYVTYSGCEHDVAFDDHGVMVLGCGPYAIGSSVEFDWAAVSCIRALKESGKKTIVVNFNPETVSTDYDESDRLYFEELSLERILDIYEAEQSEGVIISVGGQIPNNLSLPLAHNQVRIFGTAPTDIECAEDRSKFSDMCDRLGIDQPEWVPVTSVEKAYEFVERVDFPVLVRPSFVLSGAAMSVCMNEEHLRQCLGRAAMISSEYPVVVSKFVLGAKEIEFDAVADHGEIINYAISEHVENAGVHSGDATLLLPSMKLYTETERRIRSIARAIAKELHITGPFNIQLLAKNNDVKVIECNLRASRTFPFISKTFDFNVIELATRVMVGLPYRRGNIVLKDLNYVGCKAPMFSFTRLSGADPTTGVEMASTGEVACYGESVSEAFLKAVLSTNFHFKFFTPEDQSVRNFLISIPEDDFNQFREGIEILKTMNIDFYATKGTFARLQSCNIDPARLHRVYKSNEGNEDLAVDYIRRQTVHLAIIVPNNNTDQAITEGYKIRRMAVDFNVPLIVNIKCALEFVRAFEKYTKQGPEFLKIKCMQEYYDGNK